MWYSNFKVSFQDLEKALNLAKIYQVLKRGN